MNMEVKNKAPERIKLETRIRTLDVIAVTDITPNMRRVRLAGPELDGFQSPGHADHIKVFISSDGRPLGRPACAPKASPSTMASPSPSCATTPRAISIRSR